MLSKTLTSVLMRRLLASEFNVRTTVFTRWWAKKFFSVHSSSNYYTGKFDRLFENETAQKYFNFIEESDYYHRKVDATQRELFGTVIKLLQKKKQMEVELKSLGNMNSEGDREMEKLVEEEKESLANDLQQLKCEIFENILLICDDSYDDGFTEVQIIPAVGGDEAKLFAEELYNMYLNYISYKNWECLLSELRGEKSEIRCGYILLSGDSVVFNQIRHEAGVHRVQRVPVTEKSGRTHTSTCSVAVLRKPKTSDIILKDKDLIFETVRSSGPGGQNVNKLETCVKVKHIPTAIQAAPEVSACTNCCHYISGITTECQSSRYQFDNKKFALQKLKNILCDKEQQKIDSERKTLKKEQVGTNDYSSKIRTYNYNQNRVTDHRINYTMNNLLGFLSGGKDLDNLIKKVSEFRENEILLKYFEKVLNSVEYKSFEEMNLNRKTKTPKQILS